jgi:outer membrane protein OmpA-like peptidoglycan-associated protein
MRRALSALLFALSAACASAGTVVAEAEIIRGNVVKARAKGGMECAPVELATAEAQLDFAQGELSQGSSGRAAEHVREAKLATQALWDKTRLCSERKLADTSPPPVVVRIEESDVDGDGVPDKVDRCPNQPEDKDGFQDDDGCPDPDNDGDGITDDKDKCPNEPGPVQNEGCPKTVGVDTDGDGIPDDRDKCPNQPEDLDGFQDDDGCPEPDNDGDGLTDGADKCPNEPGPVQNLGCPVTDKDGDGIPDAKDKCPDEPEDKDGFQDDDGCPDLDNDQDGIPDAQDKCPNEAGPKEEGGCPRRYEHVVVKKDRIEIKQQIRFKTKSAKITGKDSFAILLEVAQALRDNKQIKKVRIEGHTDSVGNDAANLKLSQSRADAVMAALIKDGVDPGRLEAVGFGETKPIASNSSAAGRAENRRTEFNIVEQ